MPNEQQQTQWLLLCFGGEGGIRTRGGFYPSHAFQACDLNRSSTSPVGAIVSAHRRWPGARSGCVKASIPYAFCTRTMVMADAIRVETSVMLLGTIKVVVASLATRL